MLGQSQVVHLHDDCAITVRCSGSQLYRRSHRYRSIVSLLGLLVVSCGVLWCEFMLFRSPSDEPELVVHEESAHFGTVVSTDSFTWDFSVRNQSDDPVEIFDIVSSCLCTKIEPTVAALAPGEVCQFRLTLDLTPKGSIESALKPFSVELVPITKGTTRPLRWTMQGIVRYPIIARPSTVDFGQSLIRGSEFHGRTVRIETDEALAKLTAGCDPQWGTAILTPLAERAYELTVTPAAVPPVDYLDFPVVLRGQLKNGAQIAPVSVRVSGKIVGDLQVDPPVVLFSEAANVREAVVTVKTRTGRRISGLQFTSNDPTVQIRPHEDGEGDWPRFSIQLADWSRSFRTTRVGFFATPVDDPEALAASLAVLIQPEAK